MSDEEEVFGESIFDFEEDGIKHEVIYVAHVCIIESPSASDRQVDRREGLALSESLKLAGIRHTLFDVHDSASLESAFNGIGDFCSPRCATANNETGDRKVIFPRVFVHFSCHGNAEGIGLTSGEFVPWRTIGESLMKIAESLGAIGPGATVAPLYVCMSSCSGLHAKKMAAPESCPFLGLVGCKEPVNWQDALNAFSTFYHQVITKGRTVTWAVESINESSLQRVPFELVTIRDIGVPGYDNEVNVVLMSVAPNGRFIWLHDQRTGRPAIPAIWPKDDCRDPVTGDPIVDPGTGKPFPYFEDPVAAVEYLRAKPGSVCQVERSAAQEILIRFA